MNSSYLQDETLSGMPRDPCTSTKTHRHRVLVIEDDEEMQGLLDEELHESGVQVQQAMNGKEALTYLETGKPDIVVSDFRIPDGGLNFLQAIRKKCGSCRITVVTAMRDDITRQEVEQQGVDAFLGKLIRIS